MIPFQVEFRWVMALVIWLAGSAMIVFPLELDVHDSKSITIAASETIKNLFSNSTSLNGTLSPLYTGNEPPDEDVHTFNEGILYATLIQFWNTTEIGTYKPLVAKRMDIERIPLTWEFPNQALGAWGLASMTAAEMHYPEMKPTSSWLQFAGKVLVNIYAKNWDDSACNGGLLLGINEYEKDALSNGIFFQLAARLAYATTGSEREEYTAFAVDAWEWSVNGQLLDETKWSVIMAVGNSTKGGACSPLARWEWSYAHGLYLSGAAYMYKATNGSSWKERVDGLLQATIDKFFVDGVMTELGPRGSLRANMTIDYRMTNMVGLLASSLAAVVKLLPETAKSIAPLLRNTAIAAAKQCSGSVNKTLCGSEWTKPTYDGNPGIGSSLSAINLFTSLLLLPEEPENKLSEGEIAGIAVGSGAGVALIAMAVFLAVRRRRKNRKDAVADREYTPCHIDQTPDGSGTTVCSHGEVSELPVSKDGGMVAHRHELDSIDGHVGSVEGQASEEIFRYHEIR